MAFLKQDRDVIDLVFSPNDITMLTKDDTTVLPLVNSTNAGLISPQTLLDIQQAILDIQALQALHGNGTMTDISVTHSATNAIVQSSDGTDGTIELADSTQAGLMSPALFDSLSSIGMRDVAHNIGTITTVNSTTDTIRSSLVGAKILQPGVYTVQMFMTSAYDLAWKNMIVQMSYNGTKFGTRLEYEPNDDQGSQTVNGLLIGTDQSIPHVLMGFITVATAGIVTIDVSSFAEYPNSSGWYWDEACIIQRVV